MDMQQVKHKQSTFKWAMTLKSHYFVRWMQSLMNIHLSKTCNLLKAELFNIYEDYINNFFYMTFKNYLYDHNVNMVIVTFDQMFHIMENIVTPLVGAKQYRLA